MYNTALKCRQCLSHLFCRYCLIYPRFRVNI
nr:MAG TPA: SelR domain [Caudoviricetes sp.]